MSEPIVDWYLNPNVQAAFVAALVATFVFVARDLILPLVRRRMRQREEEKTLYELYALPLSAAARSLFFRLREILEDRRYEYLSTKERKTKFDRYKQISTLYRLACLVGWIRALRRERSFLIHPEPESNAHLYEVVSDFENALADGPHVEISVLESLASLWSVDIPNDHAILRRLASGCNSIRQIALAEGTPVNGEQFEKLDSEFRFRALKDISSLMENTLHVQVPTDKVIRETLDGASHILSPKQAWIFRDWQSAIGDIMIKNIVDSPRRFELIGFHQFEAMFLEKNRWIAEIECIFSDIDLDEIDQQDFRIDQLKKIMNASAKIIVVLEKRGFGRQLVDRGAFDAAKTHLTTIKQE